MDLGPSNHEMPPAYVYEQQQGFTLLADAAQYGGSDYANAVRVERGISLEQAFEIAKNDPNIDYFFYTKGYMMVLNFPQDVSYDPAQDPLHLVTEGYYRFDDGSLGQGYMRLFQHGDVVFFKNEGKRLGSAPGLADVYVKN